MGWATALTGSVPEAYDRYMAHLFEPYADDLAERVPAGSERVLELACGTGIVTKRLRDALPSSAVLVATDLNEPMLERARRSVAAADITWQQADAQALPFEGGSFDTVVWAFGRMFLPDKVRGFREAKRVLSCDGVLLGNVWCSRADNPTPEVIQEVVERLFPDDTPRFLDAPYGYCDEDRIRADLHDAGWPDPRLEVVSLEVESASADDVAKGWVRGTPLAGELVERQADLDAVERAVAEALAATFGSAPYRSQSSAIVITATR
jgi:ubiquinone/menaquinone biosynthesis C-methylase UbiE